MELIDCSSFRYRVLVIGYVDLDSTVPFGEGFIDLDDGNGPQLLSSIAVAQGVEVVSTVEDETIARVVFIIESVSYRGPGTYTVSYREENRNDNTLNIPNSVNTPFYVETQILIAPDIFGSCNNTPVLTIPPVDVGGVGVAFFHNPGAFDPDGDSLAFRLVLPKSDRGFEIPGYTFPDTAPWSLTQEDGSVPPFLELDQRTGDLEWNAPAQAGQFNIAFVVEEWRKIDDTPILIGYVTRDMQILVIDANNDPPEIEDKAICVEAGTFVQETITANDENGDPVRVDAFGEPFLVSPPFQANFDFSGTDAGGFKPVPAAALFTWQTDCSLVRESPYVANFRVRDNPITLPGEAIRGPAFTRFGRLEVSIIAPAPTLLSANPTVVAGNPTVDLNWEAYTCNNADEIEIYKRFGTLDYTPDECETGVPAGYRLVGTVDADEVNFQDIFNSNQLPQGTTICYRIVATFEAPEGGESIVSNEVCVEIEAVGPIMTLADVERTETANGAINVEWIPGFDLDPLIFEPPYTYELYRLQGFGGNSSGGQLIHTTAPLAAGVGAAFTDEGLNTKDNVFSYYVQAFDTNGQQLPTSATASSVRLDATPGNESIDLAWDAVTPWNNFSSQFPTFEVFRDRSDPGSPDDFNRIAVVNGQANGPFYTDEGTFGSIPLEENTEYCYYVVTRGRYEEASVPAPIVNRSQIICSIPGDDIPPCEPLALEILNSSIEDCRQLVSTLPCNFRDFSNVLQWNEPGADGSDCDINLTGYNIYFSPDGDESNFRFLDFTSNTRYTHSGLSTLIGCYRITAVDASGNESLPSAVVCNDNCPVFALPNVITLNGDGFNDTFRAGAEVFPFQTDPITDDQGNPVASGDDNCPRFVEKVEVEIFNRWGTSVFNYSSGGENSILIDWDGRDSNGNLVSSGVYYYLAKVTFDVLAPAEKQRTYKGWLHILGQ